MAKNKKDLRTLHIAIETAYKNGQIDQKEYRALIAHLDKLKNQMDEEKKKKIQREKNIVLKELMAL